MAALADARYPVVVEQQLLEPRKPWEAFQSAYGVVRQVYTVKLVLRMCVSQASGTTLSGSPLALTKDLRGAHLPLQRTDLRCS